MTQMGSNRGDEFLRDTEGKLITDRFGRPIRRRSASSSRTDKRPSPARSPQEGGVGGTPRPSQSSANSARGVGGARPSRAGAPMQHTRFDIPVQPSVSSQSQAPRPTRNPRSSQAGSNVAGQQPRQYYPPSAPAGAKALRRRRFRLRPSGCMGGVGMLLLIVLVISLAGTLWLDSRLNRVQSSPEVQIADTAGTNWLLVGSDSREGMSEEDVQRLGTGGDIGSRRTDTIMVLHIPLTGQSTLVSLPRDSYVDIPGFGMNKINAAFTFGGAPLLTQTVEQATGLSIDHYAEIGMGGLANVVDAVGSIQICPDQPIVDPLANLNIQAGCQQADGPTALGYVRTRATPMGDLDRVQRQREFFSALVDKATSTSTFVNPLRALPTINAVAGSFTVGERDHVWDLMRVAFAMRGGTKTETVPYAGFADYDVGNVVIWDEQGAQALFDSLR